MWYAFRTAPMKEFASETLVQDRHSLPVLVPRETKWKRVGLKRKKTAFVYPMLPRYLFANLPDHAVEAAMLAIMRLDPIQGVVGFGGIPARIPDKAIAGLIRMSGSIVPTKVQPVHKSFVAGDKVEISKGAMAGHVVPVLGIKGRHARVLVEMFGSAMECEIPLENLEAA